MRAFAALALLALEKLSRARKNVVWSTSPLADGTRERVEALEASYRCVFPEFCIRASTLRQPYLFSLGTTQSVADLIRSSAPDTFPPFYTAALCPLDDEGRWRIASAYNGVVRGVPLKGHGLLAYKILTDEAFARGATAVYSGGGSGSTTSEAAGRLWEGLVARGFARRIPGKVRGFVLDAPFEILE